MKVAPRAPCSFGGAWDIGFMWGYITGISGCKGLS